MSDLAPGTEFGGCRIEGIAGRGGMGVVYAATELRLDRPVAVKLIATDHARDAEFRARFERESRLAASIDHPNVIPVYGAGEQDGRPYLVMRLVRGTDLQEELTRFGPLEPRRAARLIGQVAAALDAAHAAGLVHRDVKPANVLLDDDHVYLTDFGLTRLVGSDTRITETGRWMGTVDFASPEQLSAQRTDARSDVYALGCVLYTALVGEPPFARATVPAAIYAHLHDPIPRPSDHGAPAAFDRVLARALAKDPADRYPSAGDLGRAAAAAARGDQVTEEERTVATGPAAPQPDAPTAVLDALTTPVSDLPPPPGGAAPAGRRPRDVAQTAGPHAAPTRRPPPDRRDGVPAGRPHVAARAGDDRRTLLTPDPAPTALTPDHPLARTYPGSPAERTARRKADRAARRSRRRGVVAVVAFALVGLAAVGGLAIAGAGGGDPVPAVEAVTGGEVQTVVDRFAAALSEEDLDAFGDLLTADAKRVSTSTQQDGRRAVLGVYRDLFAADDIASYDVSDVRVLGGRVGRAEGDYSGRDAAGRILFSGRFTLIVVKEGGEERIRLLVAVPDA